MTSPTEKFRNQLIKSQKLIAARLSGLTGEKLMQALTELERLEKFSSWQFPADSAGSGVIGEESLRMSRQPQR